MDDLRCYLTAQELIKAFEPWEGMRAAGYRTMSEFFDRHGWHLNVREIREILDRETEALE
ncbi:MAG TPA: hypothetical protein VFO40_29140 [Chthoniobacterales bacterium]|jgi:hypothetical protein|nr:hypothetical protein [Chthoniobacterales bacterium]